MTPKPSSKSKQKSKSVEKSSQGQAVQSIDLEGPSNQQQQQGMKSSGPVKQKVLRIGFIHPDLGIGGAERLVVDAAIGLQQRGHIVDVYTSHYDSQHCFQETRSLHIRVWGDELPRKLFGKGHILFAILRSWYLALLLLLHGYKYDVLFVDQISASIPLLRLTGAKILFYCHFPDKLLTHRTTWIKTLYRWPADVLEEFTTRHIY